MLSKGLIKLVNSLKHKKYRQKHGLFVAEGQKMVEDLLSLNIPVKTIISSNKKYSVNGVEFIPCKEHELRKISFLKTSPDVMALVQVVEYKLIDDEIKGRQSIALDGVQDPGNMGTIIRIANWFGIENILCSNDCVDIYNPKVVQASMGALVGTKVHYVNLIEKLESLSKLPDYYIYGTFMQGESIYQTSFSSKGLIVMGSEGRGISKNLEQLITKRVSIPSFAKEFKGAESLNVGVASGIIVSEFARQRLKIRN